MHVGRGGTASKTEAMCFPSPRQRYTDGNTSDFPVDDTGSVSFTESFRYLGSIIYYSLTSDADVDYRTRTRTNTNPNDTEANAAGRSVRACVARKSKS